ncbi:MAG TPA: carbohydrate kinase family protein [Actinophytocola sp.]|uniref:carbohydrate kinase family protein n=1 Tax=Actinophytocola sp. TaxID=1872138 RepID=UPI002DDD3F14|nr:carbohydrate kinase family protein [Actinophytocola sp.]HEV2783295.1 carbohydrate kinase family protein [Actinophytocola sp.]
MRIAVTGSIATDHLMVFPGSFANQFLAGSLDKVSLSFLVDRLDIRRGGVAANIALGLGRLGGHPLLVGAVGTDFDSYRDFLEAHGVNTRWVHVSTTKHTARFLCTTDDYQNQIASFYPGAMTEARRIALRPIAEGAGGLDLVLISPNDPEAMLRHTDECREHGYPFAADPSQQLATLGRAEIRSLVDGAMYLFTNEYESELLLTTARWTREQVLDRVGTWITTLGENGVRIESAGAAPATVGVVPDRGVVDPTGVGDGFRAGFLSGLAAGLSQVRSAQVGCTVATLVLEARGPQEYELDPDTFQKRVDEAYGLQAAREVEPIVQSIRQANEDHHVRGYD